MDPLNPASFNHKTEPLYTGRTYHFVDQIPVNYDPKRNPTLLCLHGFPDLWYGYRYQIGPWVKRGARVVVPDMLGYGGTSKPLEAAEYSTKKLSADLVALLDCLGVRTAVVIGHDWGSYAAGRLALWHPERVSALVMMSVPYIPPSPVYHPIEKVAELAPNFGYQVYFASSRSTLEIMAHLNKFLRVLYSPPDQKLGFTELGQARDLLIRGSLPSDLPCVLRPEELEYYESQFKAGGMNGPLNYYRTSQFRHEEEAAYGLPTNLRSDLPFLFIWGTADATATPSIIRKSAKFVNRYQDLALEGKGHWVMVEAKEEVTKTIIDWLEGLTSAQPDTRTKL